MNKKGLFSKIGSFLGEVSLETKKVSWPTRKEAVKYTLIVVGVSISVATFLGGLDYILRILIF